MKRKRFLLGVLLCTVAMFAGCSKRTSISQNQEGEPKDTLTVACQVDPDGLDPQRTSAVSSYLVTNSIYDTLIGVTPEWELVPRLAENWSMSDDGKELTFQLRQGVTFHNGRTMTAKDVQYSLERLQDAQSPKSKEYANIKEIEVVDDLHVVVKTKNLDVNLLSSFAYPWAAIVPEEAENLKANPVGTGPYRFREWVPKQYVLLERNEEYFDQKAVIPNVKFAVIPDPSSQLAGLQVGDLDVIEVSGDQIEPLRQGGKFQVQTEPMNAVQIMALNTDHPILSDVKVRQAISMAIDKDAVIEGAAWGYGDKIGSHIPVGSPDYLDTNQVLGYNPEKAKELLKEAGYENGFSITLTVPENYKIHVDTGQIIADQLEKIGIRVEIQPVEWGVWLSDVYGNKNYEMTIVAHSGRLNSYDFLSRYRSDSGDYISLKTGELDKLLDAVQQEKQETARTELYQQMQTILAEQVPAVYIHTPHKMFGVAKNVTGIHYYPIDVFDLKNVTFGGR